MSTPFFPVTTSLEHFYYKRGFISSVVGHLFVVALVLFRFQGWGDFKDPVVYSVTIEGGRTLGGIAQVPKPDQKSAIAPPKNVKTEEKKSEPEVKKEEVKKSSPEEKPVEDPKNLVKIPDKEKKKDEKKALKKDAKKDTKEESPEEINKRLQSAMQRYLGESSAAGGKGFGAAALGGKGMGGGVVRPPEFFVYAKRLEEHIKSGWIWNDTSAALITQVTFEMSPDGRISAITLAKGSGSGNYDDSVMRAVYKADPAPPPPASVYEFFRSVRMTFDPRE